MKKMKQLLLLSMLSFFMAFGLFGVKAYAGNTNNLGAITIDMRSGEYILDSADKDLPFGRSLNALVRANRINGKSGYTYYDLDKNGTYDIHTDGIFKETEEDESGFISQELVGGKVEILDTCSVVGEKTFTLKSDEINFTSTYYGTITFIFPYPDRGQGTLNIDLRSASTTINFEGDAGTAFFVTFLDLGEEAQFKGDEDGTLYLDGDGTGDVKIEVDGTKVTFTKLSSCSVKGTKEFKISEAAKKSFINNNVPYYSSFKFILPESVTPEPAPTPTPVDPTPDPGTPEAGDSKTGTETTSKASESVAPVVSANESASEKVDNTLKKTKISSIKAGKKSLTVSWKKQAAGGIKGYELQYSTDKNFKTNVKSVSINKTKTTSKTIKKLKSKTKYYVRIRTYKKSGGEKVYSNWSKSKNVKVK